MIRLIDTLRSALASKKLAYTDDLFDELLQKHQNEINIQLTELINTISDIKDNLTSTDKNKPLSANQGRLLKMLLDAKVVEVGGVAWDAQPTKDSLNGVISNGVFEAVDAVTPIYLTQDEYDQLVIEGLIDPNKDYNIYEDEES